MLTLERAKRENIPAERLRHVADWNNRQSKNPRLEESYSKGSTERMKATADNLMSIVGQMENAQ